MDESWKIRRSFSALSEEQKSENLMLQCQETDTEVFGYAPEDFSSQVFLTPARTFSQELHDFFFGGV